MYNVCMLNRKDELISERLTLKSIEEDSKKELLEIVKDPLVKKSYMLPDFSNEKEEENFFQKQGILRLIKANLSMEFIQRIKSLVLSIKFV